LLNYERLLFNTLHDHKHVWVKKATGPGITEFMFRYIEWLCVRDDSLRGAQICFATGPRIELAIELIKWTKRLFEDLKVSFDTRETELESDGVHIEAFPSHILDAMHSLKDPKFILLDEEDYFPTGQQQYPGDVSERYIVSSNPGIAMVSAPNVPGGLFERIEKEPESTCLYHRF
jgi:late competence protein required for DNA uptake (superfamily II DNA/RNA helicase)